MPRDSATPTTPRIQAVVRGMRLPFLTGSVLPVWAAAALASLDAFTYRIGFAPGLDWLRIAKVIKYISPDVWPVVSTDEGGLWDAQDM